MNKTTTVSALFLTGAMLLSITPVQAFEVSMPSKTTLAAAAAAAAFGALYTRKSEKNFTPRYNLTKTRNITKVFSKDYVQNLWFMFYDGFIGQRKNSSVVKVKEDGKVYVSEETPASGVLGTVDSYVAPAVDGAKTYLFSYALYKVVTDANGDFARFVRAFASKGATEIR